MKGMVCLRCRHRLGEGLRYGQPEQARPGAIGDDRGRTGHLYPPQVPAIRDNGGWSVRGKPRASTTRRTTRSAPGKHYDQRMCLEAWPSICALRGRHAHVLQKQAGHRTRSCQHSQVPGTKVAPEGQPGEDKGGPSPVRQVPGQKYGSSRSPETVHEGMRTKKWT